MGGLSVLFNIPSLEAQNQLTQTNNSLQNTLTELTTGSRINSGADDPAGLQIANLLNASVSALNQSVNNANNGTGFAQVAEGALSQVSTLLNTAVTLATEAANGGLSSAQSSALNTEFQSLLTEINNIGSNTNFNGTSVFTTASTYIFLTDLASSYTIAVAPGNLSASALGLSTGGANLTLTTTADAQTALAAINSAIISVGVSNGDIGAAIDQMQDAQNVETVESQNVTNALSTITSANIPQVVSNLNEYTILDQTGIYSLTEANSVPQNLLKLLQ
jgi:flagellin